MPLSVLSKPDPGCLVLGSFRHLLLSQCQEMGSGSGTCFWEPIGTLPGMSPCWYPSRSGVFGSQLCGDMEPAKRRLLRSDRAPKKANIWRGSQNYFSTFRCYNCHISSSTSFFNTFLGQARGCHFPSQGGGKCCRHGALRCGEAHWQGGEGHPSPSAGSLSWAGVPAEKPKIPSTRAALFSHGPRFERGRTVWRRQRLASSPYASHLP